MFGRNNKLDVDWLSKHSFFDSFSAAQVEQIAELGHRVDADPGAELTDQGRFGDVCYLIIEGTANVLMRGEYVATVGPGTMVGEMALLEHRPRNATVVAETDMVLVSFGTKEFRKILDDNPDLRERVHALLVARERDNSARG
ncbi:MAG: cyclic nucleotide-binding domain-containing protein [Acidimicrobiales bacterium]